MVEELVYREGVGLHGPRVRDVNKKEFGRRQVATARRPIVGRIRRSS
jgi:hypothetical protein